MLAWLWVICLGLTILTLCIPPLEFSSITYRSVAHSGAWLLAFIGAGYFAKHTSSPTLLWLLRWMPRIQWGGVALLLLVFLWYGALYLYYFFLATGSPNDTQFGQARILMRRGDTYALYRNVVGHSNMYGTLALVRPISPFFNWVRPITSGEYDSWANMDKPTSSFLQGLENLSAAASAAVDSIDAAFDKEPLPLITHTGRGTLGFVINGKNRHATGSNALSVIIKRKGFFNLEASMDQRAGTGNIRLSVILSHFQGAGTYQMMRVDGPNAVDNRLYIERNIPAYSQTYKSVASQPATLVITHFNANQHIIAGTFAGVLYGNTNSDSIVITQGRFDLHYK